MLALIFFYMLITITCLWTGYMAFHIVTGMQQHTSSRHWILHACWGLILISFIAQIAELFLPLNQASWFILVLLLSLLSLFYKSIFISFLHWIADIRKTNAGFIFISAVHILFIALYNAGPTLMDDTDSYHIQMIKWIQEYGSPPGLANLHERYGFNSSWFAFVSYFIPSNTSYNFFTVTNGVLSAWLAVYLLQNTWQLMKLPDAFSRRIAVSSFIIFVAALFCWPMIRGNATTANYDFVSAFLILVLLIEVSKLKENWKDLLPELFIWPVFLFTIRIINYPILLISLFSFLRVYQQRRFLYLATGVLFSLGLLIPFLTRNVILSGYLFYPVYQVDLFSFDWEADKGLAMEIVDYIKYFNRVNAGVMPTYETAKLESPYWIPVWFRHLFVYDKPIVIAGISAFLLAFIRWRQLLQLSAAVKIFFIASILQLISWFLVAPDPRFVYGPLFAGIFLIPFLLNVTLQKTFYNKVLRGAVLLVTVSIMIYAGNKMLRDQDYNNPVMPVVLPSPPVNTRVRIDNIIFSIPAKLPENWNPRCYATSLPCLYSIQPGLKPRGSSISDGFKMEK